MDDINITLLVFCCIGWLGFLGTWLGALMASCDDTAKKLKKRGICPECGRKLEEKK